MSKFNELYEKVFKGNFSDDKFEKALKAETEKVAKNNDEANFTTFIRGQSQTRRWTNKDTEEESPMIIIKFNEVPISKAYATGGKDPKTAKKTFADFGKIAKKHGYRIEDGDWHYAFYKED